MEERLTPPLLGQVRLGSGDSRPDQGTGLFGRDFTPTLRAHRVPESQLIREFELQPVGHEAASSCQVTSLPP